MQRRPGHRTEPLTIEQVIPLGSTCGITANRVARRAAAGSWRSGRLVVHYSGLFKEVVLRLGNSDSRNVILTPDMARHEFSVGSTFALTGSPLFDTSCWQQRGSNPVNPFTMHHPYSASLRPR
jgi:hypothetical protein